MFVVKVEDQSDELATVTLNKVEQAIIGWALANLSLSEPADQRIAALRSEWEFFYPHDRLEE